MSLIHPALYQSKKIERLAALIILFILVMLPLSALYHARANGNNLSPLADPFSEANALRAGMHYVEHGFLANLGLPATNYGTLFPDIGHTVVFPPGHIYTHYPPLPDLTVGLLIRIFGINNINRMRAFPILIFSLCFYYFVHVLLYDHGVRKTALLLLGLVPIPMFTNMMEGLHFQGYAHSLFLLELAVLIRWRTTGQNFGGRLFLISFLQGWLSFDYCFLVILAPLVVFLADPKRDETIDRSRLFIWILATTAGFALAVLLHFYQVVLFHGSIALAMNDFTHAAERRFSTIPENRPHLLNSFELLWLYIGNLWRSDLYFGFSFFIFLLPLSALFVRRAEGSATTIRGTQYQLGWHVPPTFLISLLAAFVVSFLWIVMMRNHSMVHVGFIPRHMFLFYFWGIYLWFRAIHIRVLVK